MKTQTTQFKPVNLPYFSILFMAVFVSVFAAQNVLAWNHVGHPVVAELAWRQLSKGERRSISDLLRQHPHYNEILAANIPAGVDTNEWAFLVASNWPDLVRTTKPGQPQKPESITKYDVHPHAVGYPFLKPGETNSALLENFFIAKPDSEMVLSNSIAMLNDRKASAHDRAVSLCWTLHLMGDLHQPLHAASMVSKERQDWDGLGGKYIAIDPRDGEQVNFHVFWDRLPGSSGSYESIAKIADVLTTNPTLKPSAMKEYREHKSVALWVQESFRHAVDFAYAEGVDYAHVDDLKSGKISDSAIPILKMEYISGAEKIAHRRLALASQRLADELKRTF